MRRLSYMLAALLALTGTAAAEETDIAFALTAPAAADEPSIAIALRAPAESTTIATDPVAFAPAYVVTEPEQTTAELIGSYSGYALTCADTVLDVAETGLQTLEICGTGSFAAECRDLIGGAGWDLLQALAPQCPTVFYVSMMDGPTDAEKIRIALAGTYEGVIPNLSPIGKHEPLDKLAKMTTDPSATVKKEVIDALKRLLKDETAGKSVKDRLTELTKDGSKVLDADQKKAIKEILK